MQFSKKSYANKHEHKDIYFVLLPMILSVCLCVTFFMGSTFAWFSASQSMGIADIQMADYSVAVTVDGEDLDSAKKLSKGTYDVVITATGTATNGYCILFFDGAPWRHTIQIPVGSSLTFKLKVEKEAEFEVFSQWGSSSMNNAYKITNREAPYEYGIASET